MSVECSECERDARGGHDPTCSRCAHCSTCGCALVVLDEEVGDICPYCIRIAHLEQQRDAARESTQVWGRRARNGERQLAEARGVGTDLQHIIESVLEREGRYSELSIDTLTMWRDTLLAANPEGD